MNWYSLVLWFISLGPEAPRIIELARGVFNATDHVTRWATIKQLGDAILPFIDSFPLGAQQLSVEAMASQESQLAATGVDLAGLKELLPIFEFLLPLLLQWFKRQG